MLELDLILLGFVERHYPQLSAADQRAFEKLLNVSDPNLFAYLNGISQPSDGEIQKIVQTIRQTARL